MKDCFSKQATTYAKYRPTYPQGIYDIILEHVPEKGLAWDCGTGNGQVAGELAPHFEKVYGTDISLDQLSLAKHSRKIEYLQFPSEETPFADNIFDLVTTAQALHWFDVEKYYEEVQRVLKPNGVFAAWGYEILRSPNEEVQAVLEEFSTAMQDYWADERKLLDDKYQTLAFPFEEIEVSETFLITKNWTGEELAGFLSSWSSVQVYKDKNKKDPIEPFKEKLYQAIPSHKLFEVQFPVFMRLGKMK